MTRFDETIKKMQDISNDIKNEADEVIKVVDPSTKEKIQAITNKTIDTIQEAAVRLKDTVKDIDEQEELDTFLKRVVSKCEDAKVYAFKKFAELIPVDAEYESIEDSSKSTMEKFLNNENIQKAAEFVINGKDKIVDYLTSEKTKQKAKDITYKTLDIVDKGLDKILEKLNKENSQDD